MNTILTLVCVLKVSIVDDKAKGPECHNENWRRRNIRKHTKSAQNEHISRFYNGCTPVAKIGITQSWKETQSFSLLSRVLLRGHIITEVIICKFLQEAESFKISTHSTAQHFRKKIIYDH